MNKPPAVAAVSALVTIVAALVAAFAIPHVLKVRSPGAVVQENSTDPDLKAIFDNARNRGGQVITSFLSGATRRNSPEPLRPWLTHPLRHQDATSAGRACHPGARPQLWEGDYEINQHRPMMRACGYTPQQIEAVGNWRASTLFNDRQRALLAYVDQAPAATSTTPTFAAFEKFFDTQEIVEITITVDTYVGTALFTRALRIKIEDDGRLTAIGKC